MEMNYTTKWTNSKGDRLQCSVSDTICSCNYYTTLHMRVEDTLYTRRQRVSVRPFDIYNCPFSAGALDQPSPPPSTVRKMQLGDISVFLNKPLRGWYFANIDRVNGTETSSRSVDACECKYYTTTEWL